MLTFIPDNCTALMRPRRWKHYCLQLDIDIDIDIRDNYDVIIMVFKVRLLFNQWYACSGGRHLVDHVFFQSEPSTPSAIHI